MKTLEYNIKDSRIAELLGRDNFNNKESAILELIKNAYDAKSSLVEIRFILDSKESLLIINDFGEGMTEEDLLTKWSSIGNSDRDYEIPGDESRIYTGSKGIGRFALARLGNHVEMITKNNKSKPIRWITDWTKNQYEIIDENEKKDSGTKFIIKQLRDKWNKAQILRLTDFISRVYRVQPMEIKFYLNEDELKTEDGYFDNLKLGENYTSEINLMFNNEDKVLDVSIISDEFSKNANKYISSGISKEKHNASINIFDKLYKNSKDNYKKEYSEKEFNAELEKIGSFQAKIYFGVSRHIESEKDKYCYKHDKTILPKTNIILFRNHFSISGYDGSKDWLNLNARSRKSPAAVSHMTGSWRVKTNQITGYVLIDKKNNSYLKDLSNRQGLHENITYELFEKIIVEGIAEFEGHRQKIVREIKTGKKISDESIPNYINLVLHNKSKIKEFNDIEIGHFVAQIKDIVDETNEFKYDVQVLNTFATIGIRTSTRAHFLLNDKSFLDRFNSVLVNKLKKVGIWQTLDSPENKKYKKDNIPKLIEDNKVINEKIIRLIDSMLSRVEKRNFKVELLNLSSLLNEIKKTWEYQYPQLKIEIYSENSDYNMRISRDILPTIFDNLLLNTIQQNIGKNEIDVSIDVYNINDLVYFIYKDNGKGLNEKFSRNPMRILDVHVTDREDGHGLGMWILNNTIQHYQGDVEYIGGNKGFEIKFFIRNEDENAK